VAPALTLELHPRPPFRLDLTVWALRRREQNAIDTWDGRTYRRALLVKNEPFELAVSQVVARSALAKLLGLDIDLSGFYSRAAGDSLLSELADDYRGMKPPRFPTIFECLVNAVACQQLSIAAGLMLVNRLAATAGGRIDALPRFPTPSDVLGLPRSALRTVGFSERKAETIRELASAAETGELELDVFERLDDAAVVEALIQMPGIGRWSADYVLLRGLGRLHVFPRGDSGALRGLRCFLVGTEFEGDPEAALARWASDAGLVYLHLLLRGLDGNLGWTGRRTG
jgi:DNA-3-methyladenine glycosylase II